MNGMKMTTLFGVAVLLLIIAALLVAFRENLLQQRLLSITTFEACVAAGFPVMDSYPEQCETSDGRLFVNEKQSLASPISTNGCAVAGCSGQLCVSQSEAEGVVTTCEFRAEYACYQEAACEPQENGKCGWTETPALRSCLDNPPSLEGEPQAL